MLNHLVSQRAVRGNQRGKGGIVAIMFIPDKREKYSSKNTEMPQRKSIQDC